MGRRKKEDISEEEKMLIKKEKIKKEKAMIEPLAPLKEMFNNAYVSQEDLKPNILEKKKGIYELIERLDKHYKELLKNGTKILSKEFETIRKVVEETLLMEAKRTLSDVSFCFYNEKLPKGSFLLYDVKSLNIGNLFIDEDGTIQTVVNDSVLKNRMN